MIDVPIPWRALSLLDLEYNYSTDLNTGKIEFRKGSLLPTTLIYIVNEIVIVIEMDDFKEIRSAVDNCTTFTDASVTSSEGKAKLTKSITVTNSDPIVHLQNLINEIKAENAELRKIMKDLSGKIMPLIRAMEHQLEHVQE
jgi:hypothetical protein